MEHVNADHNPTKSEVSPSVSVAQQNPLTAQQAPLTVTEAQRNGSITGIGVILGFSLTFTGNWSLGEGNWLLSQAVAMSIALIGIGFQLAALFGVLHLPLPLLQQHRKAIRNFTFGVALVLTGFVLHVLVDIAVGTLKWHLR